jgi:hypothetical protein
VAVVVPSAGIAATAKAMIPRRAARRGSILRG